MVHGDSGELFLMSRVWFHLVFPLLARPCATTSVILSFHTAGLAVTMLSIAIAIGITFVIFYLTSPIYRILGMRGSLIITGVFAVLVAVIAVQYVVDGLLMTI